MIRTASLLLGLTAIGACTAPGGQLGASQDFAAADGADLAGSDLAGSDLAGLDLAGLDFAGADLALPFDLGTDGPLPYPTRDPMRIKGIQPDAWAQPADIADNNTGSIVAGLLWVIWEPMEQLAPCNPTTQVEHDGHCFTIDAATDATIADYSARGLDVVGVVYAVPPFARIPQPACSPATPGYEVFCATTQPAGFARFAGMLAKRYDGRHGHGRIADFVIHNEVNHNDYYDVGCGQGTPCDLDSWVSKYAVDWVAAYDAITAEQPTARVLVPLTHDFDTSFDLPAANQPSISVKSFLLRFASAVGSRKWSVAYHPYAPVLAGSVCSADDYPYVTFGNLGMLLGWLRRTFPSTPSAWDVELTESGFNSLAPLSPAQQAQAVCDSFRNVLGTPGVSLYIYHRMKDHPDETKYGLGLGLHATDGAPKPAWTTWALANRADLTPPLLSCGFEDLPYVRLTRSLSGTRGHWASTRLAPPGFAVETSWRLWRAPTSPATMPLYECGVGAPGSGHNLLSPDVGCEGLLPLGPVGYVAAAAAAGLVPLYRCRTGAGDHFVSGDIGCEGHIVEALLGWVLP